MTQISRRQFLRTGAWAGVAGVYLGGAHWYLKDDRWTPNRSIWLTGGLAPRNPPMRGEDEADLAIIGGGVTGLSTAIHTALRFPRTKIVLLEAQYVGYGATGRNGGILDDGTERGKREGTDDNIDLVIDLIDRFRIECDLDRNLAHLDPYQLAVGLKRAAETVGVTVYEDTRVRSIERGLRVTLAGEGFVLRAPRVVAAVNGYLPKLGVARNLIFPVHTAVAVTTQLPDDLLASFPDNVHIMTSKEMYVWGRKLPDGRLLVGSGADYCYDNGLYFDGESYVIDALRRFMVAEYPRLEDYPFEYSWTGPMGSTTDQEPILGTEGRDGNIYYCGGYTGLGLAMGAKAGLFVAEMLDGVEPPSWLRRDVLGLPGEPFRYVGVNAAIHLMNLSMLSMAKHD